jgi:transcriptional regulator with XRE-family HTH domain
VSHGKSEFSSLMAALSRNLTAARLSAGLTQAELAARVGVTPCVLSGLENGRSDPTLQLIEDLAAAVGCDARKLLSF